MAGGGAEERIGPFASYADAKAEWQRRAWATVDDAHARFRTEEDEVTLALGGGQLFLRNDARDCLDPLSRPGHPLIHGSGTWTVTGGSDLAMAGQSKTP